MCTYRTERLTVEGSGKGPTEWLAVTEAAVYYDHPVHAGHEHTLNIDLRNPAAGPAARVALELSAGSARALAAAITAALDLVGEQALPQHRA